MCAVIMSTLYSLSKKMRERHGCCTGLVANKMKNGHNYLLNSAIADNFDVISLTTRHQHAIVCDS